MRTARIRNSRPVVEVRILNSALGMNMSLTHDGEYKND